MKIPPARVTSLFRRFLSIAAVALLCSGAPTKPPTPVSQPPSPRKLRFMQIFQLQLSLIRPCIDCLQARSRA
ncbi:hypothetical protein AFLA_010136 [Aspergillus flavus NRRL3357]|nr:hypothetical protein AFLA_010136 [Aspergillus flavus NRRL3357]